MMAPAMPPRFVFVAGLHRTGTSVLTRLLAMHPDIAAITDAPVPENEGCYLQGAIPHTAQDGRPGHYATDPRQHLIEGCRFDTQMVRDRMLTDWDPWFAPGRRWRVEKSPVNLARMRLYQQLFPLAQFVVIMRHPQVMAAALAKWEVGDAETLTSYGLDAYDRMLEDVAYLHSAVVLRYEDFVARPRATMNALFAFLGLSAVDTVVDLRDGNADYAVPEDVSPAAANRLARWGYLPGGATGAWFPIVAHPLRAVADATRAGLAG